MAIDIHSQNYIYTHNNLLFQRVTFDNAIEAIKTQNEIFPNEDASLQVLAACDLALFRQITGINIPAEKSNYYLATVDNEIVGMTGLYTYAKTGKPNECWLAWYGVRDKFRSKGYGKSILEWTIRKATAEGYEVLRLHTLTDLYANAIKVYERIGFVGEAYTHELDGIAVYSLPLTDKPLDMLNGRFMNFSIEFEICNVSEKKKNEIFDKYNKFLKSA